MLSGSSRFVTTLSASLVSAAGLTGCSDDPTAVAPPPQPATCITGLSSAATCYSGQQLSGATYQIAVPTNWNGVLVVVARGATPVPATELRTFGAARNLLRDGGLAMAATTYRSTTPLARDATDDVEELRQIFVRQFGRPKRTIVFEAIGSFSCLDDRGLKI